MGMWRDFDELESRLSLPELFMILKTKRNLTFEEHKFLAALQGADMGGEPEQKAESWRDRMASRVRERLGKKEPVADSRDITRLRGAKARELGFGIGMGIDYAETTGGNPLLG